MKVNLDDSSRADLVAYRIERSHETLREVDYLLKGGFYNAAVSRLYYACYYIVVALLVANRLESQTHAHAPQYLSKNCRVATLSDLFDFSERDCDNS